LLVSISVNRMARSAFFNQQSEISNQQSEIT